MKILILTGKFGMGHWSASMSLRQQLLRAFPGAEAEVLDLIAYTKPNTSEAMYRWFNLLVTQGSGLFNLYYKLTEDLPAGDWRLFEEQEMDRLEERFLLHPALALEQSRQVTDAMARRAMDNLLRAMELVHKFSDKGCRAVEDAENAIDRYEDRLGTYLMKITGKELSQRQSEEVSKYLHTISDFERISDHALNICDAAREINAKSVVFSPEAERELRTLEQAITEILHLAVGAFVSGDLEGASRVEPLEEIVDGLCDEMKLHHVDRLQKGVCTLNQGFIFNDLLTNYERVADHCSNIAVAMIELESDSFDTHEYLNSVKAMKSASFARYSAEYQKKYTL